MVALEGTYRPSEVYDTHFVPALFAQWGPVIAGEAHLRTGDRVLDVACGTGALTLAAAEIAGPSGSVVGLDANSEMLAVARRKLVPIEWVKGIAEALPFPDDDFDAVVSQFGLMFFQDKSKALAEMMRVLKSGRRMAVAVCDAVENSPGYSAFALLLDRLFGKELGNAFRSPFSLGDIGTLRQICNDANIRGAEIARRDGTVRFKFIDALISAEPACVWTLGGLLTEEQFERLRDESKTVLGPLVQPDGTIEFLMPSLVVKARKS